MKRNLLATAAMCALGGAAMAQSNVTISGWIDLGVGKSIGTADKAVQESTAANSRLTFRGVEDLGGGMAALFGFEHRLRPDLGTEGVTGRFWSGYSTVGLRTPYGTVNLGRQYVPAFNLVQSRVDPFENITVANLRDIGMRPGASIHGLSNTPAGVATVSKVRVSDSIRYDHSLAGFNFAASIAESTQEGGTATGPNKPWSVAANYSGGPYFVGVSYENPQFLNDHQWNVGASYKIAGATLSGGLARGRTANNLNLRGALLGVTYPLGKGELKAGYAQSKIGDGATAVERKKVGLGYHYWLSKRTRLYADVAHEREIATQKNGYDLGLIVSF